MITIKFEFDYDGKHHKLSAYLKDDMTLSNSKKNENIELIEAFADEFRWALVFYGVIGQSLEIVMYRDKYGDKTCESEYAIIWSENGDYIEDTIDVKSKVTYR